MDLGDADFMDCSGLAVIAGVLRRSPREFMVVIRHPRAIIRVMLEITGFDQRCIIED
jgi:anti-anti-sigma factor